jgi:hypothetical protein
MTRVNQWFGSHRISIPTAELRSASTWSWIQRKPDTVTLVRGAITLDAQTVRLEFTNTTSGTENVSESGAASRRTLNIFGIQGHPSEDDTNIQRGDRFSYLATNGRLNYEVLSVDKTQLGQIQAVAEELQ